MAGAQNPRRTPPDAKGTESFGVIAITGWLLLHHGEQPHPLARPWEQKPHLLGSRLTQGSQSNPEVPWARGLTLNTGAGSGHLPVLAHLLHLLLVQVEDLPGAGGRDALVHAVPGVAPVPAVPRQHKHHLQISHRGPLQRPTGDSTPGGTAHPGGTHPAPCSLSHGATSPR